MIGIMIGLHQSIAEGEDEDGGMDGALSDQGEAEMGEEEVGCKGLKGRVTEDR